MTTKEYGSFALLFTDLSKDALKGARKALPELAGMATVLLKQPSLTWRSGVVMTKTTYTNSASWAEAEVAVHNRIYGFLNFGTSVRRAVMSKDWQSKTTPGRLSAGRGRGRVVFIGKNISLPGIKARGWDSLTVEVLSKTTIPVVVKYLNQ